MKEFFKEKDLAPTRRKQKLMTIPPGPKRPLEMPAAKKNLPVEKLKAKGPR